MTFMRFGVSTVIMGSWSVLWDTKYRVGGTSVYDVNGIWS